MKAGHPGERGYFFALPRLLVRLGGGNARRAEFSAAESYGAGIFVFAVGCVLAGRAIWEFVRAEDWRVLLLVLLPIEVWIAFLVWYYLNSLIARLLRRLGVYSARTNNPLQHAIIISVLTVLLGWLMATNGGWLRSLGVFWCALLAANLLAFGLLKILGEE